MAETQRQFDGKFCWYELMVPDTEAARTFYGKVIGWQTIASPVPDYWLFTMGEGSTPVAGLMTQPDASRKAGTPPGWIGYVGVTDVDAMTARVARGGGSVCHEPTDIPNIGRFSVVTDPQKAVFALFQPAGMPSGDCAEPDPSSPGRIRWHELLAEDWQTVLPFYQELFGWEKSDAVDMGEMGVYQTFSAYGKGVGGMFNKPKEIPVTYWQYYFTVEDIDAAAQRVTDAGGQTLCGPMQVPTGDWVLQARDPQGAVFALYGKRKA